MISVLLDTPYLATAATVDTGKVPWVYPVAVGGHPYLIDTAMAMSENWGHQTIALLKPYFLNDQNNALGERNINPESLWRAPQTSWHHGAGQTHADRQGSDPYMFRASKGIDVWTRWQFSLLPDTQRVRTSSGAGQRLTVAGQFLYHSDGTTLAYSADGFTWTAVTGLPAATILDLCSDGNTIYVAVASNGLWQTVAGSSSASQLVTGTDSYNTIGYVKGRLMVAAGGVLYNITSSVPAAPPAALFTSPNAAFTFVGFCEGDSCLYAAGCAGDKTLIYRVGILSDGTGLGAAIVAGTLPDGETVTGIGSYLGMVLAGSQLGVRAGQGSSSGDITFGPRIDTTGAVRCFEGQEQYAWFGWDNYDTVSTGLGRLDLSAFTDTQNLVPAWASDLMTAGQGHINSVVTFSGQRWWTVDGLGVYTRTANLVPSGSLDSGLIGYDIPDDKVALYLDVKHAEPLAGTHQAWIAVDSGPFGMIGQHAPDDYEGSFTVGEQRGGLFEVRTVLERDVATPTAGPQVQRYSLLAYPAVDTGRFITVPVLLNETDATLDGQAVGRDPVAELAYLFGLQETKKRTVLQEGSAAYSVTVEDIRWLPVTHTRDRRGFTGTAILKMKTV